jgi:hypothetical protein
MICVMSRKGESKEILRNVTSIDSHDLRKTESHHSFILQGTIIRAIAVCSGM